MNVVCAFKNAGRLMAGDRGDPSGKAGLPEAVKQAGPVHGKAGLTHGIAGVEDGSGTGMAQHAVNGRPQGAGLCADVKPVKHGKANRLDHETRAKRPWGREPFEQGDPVAVPRQKRCGGKAPDPGPDYGDAQGFRHGAWVPARRSGGKGRFLRGAPLRAQVSGLVVGASPSSSGDGGASPPNAFGIPPEDIWASVKGILVGLDP